MKELQTNLLLGRLYFLGDFSLLERGHSHIERKDGEFAYLDLIGVAKKHQGIGVGISLVCMFQQAALRKGLEEAWTCVSHTPKRNEEAIRIARKLGWEFDEERSFYNGLVFGIYRKDLTR